MNFDDNDDPPVGSTVFQVCWKNDIPELVIGRVKDYRHSYPVVAVQRGWARYHRPAAWETSAEKAFKREIRDFGFLLTSRRRCLQEANDRLAAFEASLAEKGRDHYPACMYLSFSGAPAITFEQRVEADRTWLTAQLAAVERLVSDYEQRLERVKELQKKMLPEKGATEPDPVV